MLKICYTCKYWQPNKHRGGYYEKHFCFKRIDLTFTCTLFHHNDFPYFTKAKETCSVWTLQKPMTNGVKAP